MCYSYTLTFYYLILLKTKLKSITSCSMVTDIFVLANNLHNRVLTSSSWMLVCLPSKMLRYNLSDDFFITLLWTSITCLKVTVGHTFLHSKREHNISVPDFGRTVNLNVVTQLRSNKPQRTVSRVKLERKMGLVRQKWDYTVWQIIPFFNFSVKLVYFCIS